MIRRQQAAGLLAALALLACVAAAQAQPAKRHAQEVAQLMVVLQREPLAVYSRAQLYEACAQKAAPPDFAAAPNDPEQAGRALGELAAEWHQAPKAQADTLARQCKRRMMRLMGPRGRYYTPAELDQWRKGGGFDSGLVTTRVDGQWVVRDTVPGGPAAAAGLKAGEVLLNLDGLPLPGMGAAEFFELLRHSTAAPMQLVSQRPGEPPQTRSLARAPTAPGPTVVVVGRAPGHLYIRLAGFFEDTPARLLQGLRAEPADESGVRVLDLRGNPGGRLVLVQWVLALFGKHGGAGAWQPVQYRAGSTLAQPFSATDSVNQVKGLDTTDILELREWLVPGKWLVLVDGETGGGAAWLAGALRELNGAQLVGQAPDASDFGVDVLESVDEAGGMAGVRYEIGLLGLPSGKVLTPASAGPDTALPAPDGIRPYPKSTAAWLQDPVYTQIRERLRP